MTTRLLPPDEWPRLAGTILEPVWQQLDPQDTRILVQEDGPVIVHCVALVREWRLDGIWAHPDYRRRVGFGRRFLRAVRELLQQEHVSEVLMMALTDDSARICRRFGRALPLTCQHFAVTPRRQSWV